MLSSTAGRQGSGAPGPRSSRRCRRPPPAGKPRLGAHVAPGPPTRREPRSPGGPLMNPLTRTTWQEPSMNRKASDPGGGRPESLLPRVPNASPRGTSRAGSAFGGKGDVFQALELRGEPAAITGQDATHAALVTGRSSSRNAELRGFWLRLGQERPRSVARAGEARRTTARPSRWHQEEGGPGRGRGNRTPGATPGAEPQGHCRARAGRARDAVGTEGAPWTPPGQAGAGRAPRARAPPTGRLPMSPLPVWWRGPRGRSAETRPRPAFPLSDGFCTPTWAETRWPVPTHTDGIRTWLVGWPVTGRPGR